MSGVIAAILTAGIGTADSSMALLPTVVVKFTEFIASGSSLSNNELKDFKQI